MSKTILPLAFDALDEAAMVVLGILSYHYGYDDKCDQNAIAAFKARLPWYEAYYKATRGRLPTDDILQDSLDLFRQHEKEYERVHGTASGRSNPRNNGHYIADPRLWPLARAVEALWLGDDGHVTDDPITEDQLRTCLAQ
jgi:hypothetical protein